MLQLPFQLHPSVPIQPESPAAPTCPITLFPTEYISLISSCFVAFTLGGHIFFSVLTFILLVAGYDILPLEFNRYQCLQSYYFHLAQWLKGCLEFALWRGYFLIGWETAPWGVCPCSSCWTGLLRLLLRKKASSGELEWCCPLCHRNQTQRRNTGTAQKNSTNQILRPEMQKKNKIETKGESHKQWFFGYWHSWSARNAKNAFSWAKELSRIF